LRRKGVGPLDLGPMAYPSLVVSVRNRWARRTGASNRLLALFIIRRLAQQRPQGHVAHQECQTNGVSPTVGLQTSVQLFLSS
jgi:hypothetical protein